MQGNARQTSAESAAALGDAIRKIYPPDAHGDERLDALIDRLRSVPGTAERRPATSPPAS